MVQAIQNTSIKRKVKLEGLKELHKRVILLYCVDQQSPQSISRTCAMSIGRVYYILRQRGIKLRGHTKKIKPSISSDTQCEPKYGTELLEYLYNYLMLSAAQISILFQTTKRNIEKILQRRGIKKCKPS